MSSEDPNEGEDQTQGQGGQTQTGGQPQGGQPRGTQPQGGQPQGTQPQGGQPQGGQPQAGGQPQGGYQQGRQPVQRESVGDIFSKPTTKDQLKTALLFYTAIGVGIGLSVFIAASMMGGSGVGGAMVAGIVGLGGLVATLVVGPAVAGPLGFHVAGKLQSDEDDQLVYATAGVGAFAGHIVMVIVAALFITLGMGGGGGGGGGGGSLVGQVLVPMFVGGLGAAIAAAGAVYAEMNFTGERPAPARQPAGQPPQQGQQAGRQQ